MGSEPLDLLIIGGSFAGLACARTAAAQGLKTLVLDRKPEAGAWVRSTGLFTPEVERESGLPPHLLRAVGGVRLYSPSLRWVDLNGGGYRYFATDTPAVLRWLADRAEEKGARLGWGQNYTQGYRWEGLIHAGTHRAKYLVGADGVYSRVARDFGLGRNRRLLFGIETEYEGVRGVDENRLHCFLTREFAPGYIGWVVPGVGVTQVGLALEAPFAPRLKEFVLRLGRLFDFSRARAITERAGWIPVGGPVEPAQTEGVLLLGDAAGHVSPLTAGGIRPALQGGGYAGNAIARHLAGGPPPDASLGLEKSRAVTKPLLRWLLESAFPDWAAEGLLRLAVVQRWAADIFFSPRGVPAFPMRRPGVPATGQRTSTEPGTR